MDLVLVAISFINVFNSKEIYILVHVIGVFSISRLSTGEELDQTKSRAQKWVKRTHNNSASSTSDYLLPRQCISDCFRFSASPTFLFLSPSQCIYFAAVAGSCNRITNRNIILSHTKLTKPQQYIFPRKLKNYFFTPKHQKHIFPSKSQNLIFS